MRAHALIASRTFIGRGRSSIVEADLLSKPEGIATRDFAACIVAAERPWMAQGNQAAVTFDNELEALVDDDGKGHRTMVVYSSDPVVNCARVCRLRIEMRENAHDWSAASAWCSKQIKQGFHTASSPRGGSY